MDLVAAIRRQAEACGALGSPMYAGLLARVADDVTAGGVLRDLLACHQDDPERSALALRLLGAVHRLVLDGSAPDLAAFYPTSAGTWDDDAGWDAFVETVRRNAAAVRRSLDQPPQTNEVGRAAALMGGLMWLAHRHALPIRLFEIGASAGLNLRADEFCYLDQHGRRHGRPDSPVTLQGAWDGEVLPEAAPLIVERRGADIAPIDVGTEDGRRTLMSYVWPDQQTRWERLRNAFDVAARVPATVHRQDARGFVDGLDLAGGTVTLLWHSVTWQYLPRPEQTAILCRLDDLGRRARADRVLAHLALEPMRRRRDADREFLVVLRTWPSGTRRVLGAAAPHGVPTVWE